MEPLKIKTLLQPIDEDNPTGCDLREDTRHDSIYYQLKDARKKARAIERRHMENADEIIIEADNWKTVYKLAIKVLTEISKDIEVACWLLEALVRQKGFIGLTEGYQLLNGLISTYWDGLFPKNDEDIDNNRFAALIGLNGETSEGALILPLTCVPLFKDENLGNIALWHYQKAANNAHDDNPLNLEAIEKIVANTNPDEIKALLQTIHKAVEAVREFYQQLERIDSNSSLPYQYIRAALNDNLQALTTLTHNQINTEAKENTDAAKKTKAAFAHPTNRQEALEKILTLSHYFRQQEPHSPISYLLERTVAFGKMSLPELTQHLIMDADMYSAYCKLIGANQNQGETNE